MEGMKVKGFSYDIKKISKHKGKGYISELSVQKQMNGTEILLSGSQSLIQLLGIKFISISNSLMNFDLHLNFVLAPSLQDNTQFHDFCDLCVFQTKPCNTYIRMSQLCVQIVYVAA